MKDKTRKLVRCIEGHVYDSVVHDTCPKCGRKALNEAAVPAPETTEGAAPPPPDVLPGADTGTTAP